jgi:hypothetical protein
MNQIRYRHFNVRALLSCSARIFSLRVDREVVLWICGILLTLDPTVLHSRHNLQRSICCVLCRIRRKSEVVKERTDIVAYRYIFKSVKEQEEREKER